MAAKTRPSIIKIVEVPELIPVVLLTVLAILFPSLTLAFDTLEPIFAVVFLIELIALPTLLIIGFAGELPPLFINGKYELRKFELLII